jgi:hypothetical protein
MELDLTDPKRTKLVKAAPADRNVATDSPGPDDETTAAAQAEEERLSELHRKLMSYYRRELEIQGPNRYEQALDEDYYDGIQLSDEDLQVLNDRGQPPIVYNVLAVSLNWIFGSEKRGRTDDKILPRGKEDAKPAERKSKYMKYLSDVNYTQFHRSAAFEDAGKVGVGWLECGLQDEDDGEPIYEGSESWRNVLWDSAGSRIGQDDWRYMFRMRWVDEDVALAMFQHIPGAADKIKNSVQDSSVMTGYDGMDGDLAMDFAETERETATGRSMTEFKRRRVRLIQCEYRNPETVKKLRGGPFNGQIFDANDPRHQEQIDMGNATVVTKPMMRMRLAIITPKEILYDAPSIYRHNSFSLTPIWCYRRGRDGMPYGFVRNMRPIQDGVNKRASKALHILSANKTIIEEGALGESMSMDQFQDENARPDGIIIMGNGKIDKIRTDIDRGMDQAHMEMMSHDVNMIQQVGGVTDELMGRKTNAVSGVAVQARQEQGSMATSGPFDNLRLAHQLHGEKKLSLVEQFATDQKQFRITNMRGVPEFVTMNDGLPENDITRSKADFIVSEADWRATMRQAANEQFGDVMMKMPPEVIMQVLDLWVDTLDIENSDELVKRIRAINGQKDPDATEPTPEDLQAEQAKAAQAQVQQQQLQLDMAERQANIADKHASAQKKLADVDVARSVMLNNNMTAANSAMSAATQAVVAPTIARVGDGLLQQGGWQGGLPVPTNLSPAAQQGIPPQAAPATPAMQGAPDPSQTPPASPAPAAPIAAQP